MCAIPRLQEDLSLLDVAMAGVEGLDVGLGVQRRCRRASAPGLSLQRVQDAGCDSLAAPFPIHRHPPHARLMRYGKFPTGLEREIHHSGGSHRDPTHEGYGVGSSAIVLIQLLLDRNTLLLDEDPAADVESRRPLLFRLHQLDY